MRWRLAVASPRTRCLFNAVWAFIWSFGYASASLIPLGVGGYRWWAPIIGFSLLVGLSIGALTAWMEQGVAASFAAVLDGLSTHQRRQVATVWRRGPAPTDPAVLIAVLRLHDLLHRYRQANRKRRVVGVVLVVIATAMLVAAAIVDRHAVSPSAVTFLLLGVLMVAAPTAASLRSRRQEPRLAALRATAQADPGVAAAVAQPAQAATPLTRAQRVGGTVAAVVLAVVYVVALQVAMAYSPRRTACRAVDAVVSEIYRDRDSLFAADALVPDGPPLSTYREWSDSLRRRATGADSDAGTALHLYRISVLGANIVGVVERARRPDQADDLAAFAENQRAYRALIQALVDEEGYALAKCRGAA